MRRGGGRGGGGGWGKVAEKIQGLKGRGLYYFDVFAWLVLVGRCQN